MKANFVLPEVTNLSGNYFYSEILPIHAILFAGRGGLLFYGCLHRACPTRDSNDCLPGLKTQQSYLRKVKVSLFTWNRCSTTWRQRAWVSDQPLGWPRSRSATPRNEQVLWRIMFLLFCRNFEKPSGKNISTVLIPSLQGQASRCRGSCGRPLFHFQKKLNLFPCRLVRNLCGLRFKFCFF